MEGKRSQRQPALLSEHSLAALEKANKSGPQGELIRRLIWNLRKALNDAEQRGWEVVELETKLADAKQANEVAPGRKRALVTVDCDGSVEVFADEDVMVKLVRRKPWEAPLDEQAFECSTFWGSIWWPGKAKASGLPHYLSPPNRDADYAIANILKWEATERTFDAVTKLGDALRQAAK